MISISSIVNVGSLVFPPREIRIWGGTDPNHLVELDHFAPARDTAAASEYLILRRELARISLGAPHIIADMVRINAARCEVETVRGQERAAQ